MERCREKNIIFLSTPYDPWSADLLEQLGVAAYKLASTDTTNLPLIRHIARKGAPFVISTAMCSMDDVRAAVNAIRAEGLEDFAVLQCTGNYPARLEDANLRVMETYRRELGCLVGYSDHTPELVNPIAATAMGACIYEKHFTLDKNLPGPDHRMSLSPQELKATVEAIRQTEQALGSAEKFVLPSEKENSLKLRKSLVAARRLRAGETLSEAMLLAKRPGSGVSPSRLDELIGRRLIRDLEEDALIQWEDVE
jgi:sialic acid synthase SpsE